MKKLLLLSAAAILTAGSAMAEVTEPTLTQDWETTENIPTAGWASTGGSARNVGGLEGKAYINEKSVGLYCYTYDETTGNVTRSTVEGVTSNAQGPWFDSAGNGVLLEGWAGAGAMTSIVVWKKGTNTCSLINITLPEGFSASRMDFIGRPVGDIFSAEGGAIYFMGANDTRIAKIWISNGVQDVEKTKLLADTEQTVDSSVIVVALNDDPESDDVAYRYRSSHNGKYGRFQSYDNENTKWVPFEDAATLANASAGGDIITLGGIMYTIEPSGTNYLDGWQIVERGTETKVVATKAEESTVLSAGNNTALYAEKLSDTKAYIYHLHPGQYLRRYTFEVPEAKEDDPTAIEEVAADNAAVEYYNLQGVKVANPENGLFIKKQGNKAVKVVL